MNELRASIEALPSNQLEADGVLVLVNNVDRFQDEAARRRVIYR